MKKDNQRRLDSHRSRVAIAIHLLHASTLNNSLNIWLQLYCLYCLGLSLIMSRAATGVGIKRPWQTPTYMDFGHQKYLSEKSLYPITIKTLFLGRKIRRDVVEETVLFNTDHVANIPGARHACHRASVSSAAGPHHTAQRWWYGNRLSQLDYRPHWSSWHCLLIIITFIKNTTAVNMKYNFFTKIFYNHWLNIVPHQNDEVIGD